jgi:tRNA(Ile)-lysidine synthetase-like protein
MLQKFTTYYQKNELFEQSDKILLAVSGGKDSMAMLQLCVDSKLNFGVAHCNFNLRGSESDADEQLVKTVCEKHNILFHQSSFDTVKYAAEKGISIQMAARDLRYNWFDELVVKNGYKSVATAHHKNDVAETMLINLAKGTGLSGLHGIKNKSGNVIRPLLDFTRQEIEAFVQEKEVIVNSVEELQKIGLVVETHTYNKDFKIETSSQYAYLDTDKIEFPLIIRNWQEGDVFQPLGMKGKKKLSDFFIDNKVDVITKQQTKILAQSNQIIWVVGYRIDDAFKVTENTKKVLVIKC